jgi:hypothetical protein
VLILIGMAGDKDPRPETSPARGLSTALSADFWYEQTVGKPHPPARYVSVITVGRDMPTSALIASNPKSNETLSVNCRRRIYLAELFKALSRLSPKVVVVDMWLDPQACSDTESTKTLLVELDQFSQQVPVVFGIGAYDYGELLSRWPAEFAEISNRTPGFKTAELISMPTTRPMLSNSRNITEGLVELNSDSRKIPLSWRIYDDFASVGQPGQPRRLDTISVAAVRALDPGRAVLKSVGALRPDGSPIPSVELHPYTSLLREDEIPIARSIDVICDRPTNDLWKNVCQTFPTYKSDSAGLTGRVVLIGQAGIGGDVHSSFIGNVPGVILQANYIESLLDGRVYRPVPNVYQDTIGAIWLLAIFWILWRLRDHPMLALLLSLLAAIVPTYLIHLLVLNFHYYTQALFPLIIATLVINIERQIERVIARQEEKS